MLGSLKGPFQPAYFVRAISLLADVVTIGHENCENKEVTSSKHAG